MSKKFGISFKGGLARGFGEIGVVRFLQEENLEPDVIAGSSAGSFVAAMFALGFPWQKMIEEISRNSFLSLTSFSSLWKTSSFVNHDKLRNSLVNNVGEINIEDLPRKLIIFATDIKKKERVYLDKGNLVDSVMASAAYPILFPSAKLHGRILIDGDLTCGYDPSKLKEYGAEKVIGVTFNPAVKIKFSFKTPLNIIVDTYRLLTEEIESVHDKNDPVDFEIQFSDGRENYSYFDLKNIDKIADRAYKKTREHQKEIFTLLN